nr:reverse transcriptase domain-containing protein [Tanacetum cinerariifolium]
MIRSWPDDMKRNSIERGESWMKAPMVFPPLSMEDASDEPLIVEAIMEGDLVRRVYVDQGASVEVMDLVGFSGGVVKPLGKIELEKVFDDGGLFSRCNLPGSDFSLLQAVATFFTSSGNFFC